MTKKEFKSFIWLNLRAYKHENISIEDAQNNIIKQFDKTDLFHYKSFLIGFMLGILLNLIILNLSL